jgi:hypothetical protein
MIHDLVVVFILNAINHAIIREIDTVAAMQVEVEKDV